MSDGKETSITKFLQSSVVTKLYGEKLTITKMSDVNEFARLLSVAVSCEDIEYACLMLKIIQNSNEKYILSNKILNYQEKLNITETWNTHFGKRIESLFLTNYQIDCYLIDFAINYCQKYEKCIQYKKKNCQI